MSGFLWDSSMLLYVLVVPSFLLMGSVPVAGKEGMGMPQFNYVFFCDIPLGCFQFWAIMNKIAVNIFVRDIVWAQVFTSLGYLGV